MTIDRAPEILAAACVALEAAYGIDEIAAERFRTLADARKAIAGDHAKIAPAFRGLAVVFGSLGQLVADEGRAAA